MCVIALQLCDVRTVDIAYLIVSPYHDDIFRCLLESADPYIISNTIVSCVIGSPCPNGSIT